MEAAFHYLQELYGVGKPVVSDETGPAKHKKRHWVNRRQFPNGTNRRH